MKKTLTTFALAGISMLSSCINKNHPTDTMQEFPQEKIADMLPRKKAPVTWVDAGIENRDSNTTVINFDHKKKLGYRNEKLYDFEKETVTSVIYDTMNRAATLDTLYHQNFSSIYNNYKIKPTSSFARHPWARSEYLSLMRATRKHNELNPK